LVERIQREVGPQAFLAKRTVLEKLRNEHQGLPEAERLALLQLDSTARERQKQKFLNTCFIENATISGVGPARKAALRSFGIETAADISRNKVMQIQGFGESLTRAMTDWRASCERRFVFNAATAVTDADRQAVRSSIAARRNSIEAALNNGPSELQNLVRHAAMQRPKLSPLLDDAARKLAQAEKDLSVL
jgi:DNA-binding helix-hairpin-helix protein with protein kinase domain